MITIPSPLTASIPTETISVPASLQSRAVNAGGVKCADWKHWEIPAGAACEGLKSAIALFHSHQTLAVAA